MTAHEGVAEVWRVTHLPTGAVLYVSATTKFGALLEAARKLRTGTCTDLEAELVEVLGAAA